MFVEVERDLAEARTLMDRVMERLSPEMVEADDALFLVKAFAGLEKLGAAGRTLLAPYAKRSQIWRKSGKRSFEAWLAAETGSSEGEAKKAVDTGERLVSQPEVEAQVREGNLSLHQADEVSQTVEAAPDSAQQMLDEAKEQSLRRLRDRGRKVRAEADPDPEATHARQHDQQHLAHGVAADGMK